MVEALIAEIAHDQRGLPSEVNGAFGVTVARLISKLSDEEDLAHALQEVEEAKSVTAQALEREAKLKLMVDRKAGMIMLYKSRDIAEF